MKYFGTCVALLSLIALSPQSHSADHVYGTVTPWGQLVDPDGDCNFNVSRDALTIGFSGTAQGLDAEQGRMNAPRVIRSMNGDFAVQVTVDGKLSLPDDESARAYVSGGLVLLQDDRNYIRFERASFTRDGVVNHYANFEQRVDAKRTRMGLFKDFPLSNDQSVDLRLEVKAGTVRALARLADQSWHEMGAAKLDGEATYSVGVSGVNTSGKPVKVTFRGIRHQQPLVAIEAESSSNLDLSAPAKEVTLPNTATSEFSKFMAEIMKLQQRGKDVDSMDAQARQQWIDDAKKVVREGKLSSLQQQWNNASQAYELILISLGTAIYKLRNWTLIWIESKHVSNGSPLPTNAERNAWRSEPNPIRICGERGARESGFRFAKQIRQ